jgi:hypothetical protein
VANSNQLIEKQEEDLTSFPLSPAFNTKESRSTRRKEDFVLSTKEEIVAFETKKIYFYSKYLKKGYSPNKGASIQFKLTKEKIMSMIC